MIVFENVGRLGNFLFEAASCMAYAWEHGQEFSVPSVSRDPTWHPVYLAHLGHLVHPKYNPNLPVFRVEEKDFRHHPRPWHDEWAKANVVLAGYFQTEKYFKHYRGRVIEAFRYPWSPVLGVVSVHVRRGDYLTIRKGSMFKHPLVTVEWYQTQMAKFPGYDFNFFSDDINYCKHTFGTFNSFSDHHGFKFPDWMSPEEKDLVAMSCCEHHICSASTFSWWSAWLNRNAKKRIIMPKYWITPGWSTLDFSDVVPKEWEKA